MQDDQNPILTLRDVKTYFPVKAGIFKRTVAHVKAVDGVRVVVMKRRTSISTLEERPSCSTKLLT